MAQSDVSCCYVFCLPVHSPPPTLICVSFSFQGSKKKFSRPTVPARQARTVMNEAPSDLHCGRYFEHTAQELHAQDLVPNLRNLHITDVTTMATKCSWNPENTTEAALKEQILQPLFNWDGTGTEPTRAPIIKQLMWECVQQYLQDTRNRFNPHLKDATK